MNRIRTSALVVFAVLAALLALSAITVSAEPASATITISESQVNSTFRVTNPINRRVTNVAVDLQPGQAVVSATLTVRAPRGQATTSYQTVSIWTPSVVNGHITWTLVSATANGTPASSQLVSQINTSIGTSWRAYWRSQHPGRATGVTVDASQVVITYS
jgi:hypothetical protein